MDHFCKCHWPDKRGLLDRGIGQKTCMTWLVREDQPNPKAQFMTQKPCNSREQTSSSTDERWNVVLRYRASSSQAKIRTRQVLLLLDVTPLPNGWRLMAADGELIVNPTRGIACRKLRLIARCIEQKSFRLEQCDKAKIEAKTRLGLCFSMRTP